MANGTQFGITRRGFTSGLGAAGLLSAGGLPPEFLCRTALADAMPVKLAKDGRILVVVQLSGGNDGLNTAIPYRDDAYYQARPGIAIPRQQVLRLGGNSDLGLHPRMSGIKSLFDDGKVALLQGVGYARPNRSHFRSMDIWHTAEPESERIVDGWLGRAIDANHRASQSLMPAVSLGMDRLPLALISSRSAVPSIRDANDYRLDTGAEPQATQRRSALRSLSARESSAAGDLDFVRQTATAALETAERLHLVASNHRSAKPYPESAFGRTLGWVSRMILGDIGTRIFYLSLDGFDTHSRQSNVHSTLLGEFSEGVSAFFADLKQHRLDDRVLLATFSEFGRRVRENASLGTDHGAASQMFLISGKLQPGVHGRHPSLTDLDDGDLKHHTDFRSVYAALLDNWLIIPSERVLGRKFAPVKAIQAMTG